jgi:hypothetical protein
METNDSYVYLTKEHVLKLTTDFLTALGLVREAYWEGTIARRKDWESRTKWQRFFSYESEQLLNMSEDYAKTVYSGREELAQTLIKISEKSDVFFISISDLKKLDVEEMNKLRLSVLDCNKNNEERRKRNRTR